VASDPNCLTCSNGTCTGSFTLGSVSLTPTASSGYTFAFWNDGTINSTDNPLTINMSGDKELTAQFLPVLKFPLSGTLAARKLSHFYFNDTWTPGQCPSGTYEKHVGVDLQATTTDEVHAAHTGIVREIFTGQHSEWADAIVIEDDNNQFTTVYWHVIKYGNLGVGDHVTKDQQIATVADLGDNTHFHLGIRMAPFLSGTSDKGALPVNNCDSKPAYPEHFVNPELVTYE